MDIHNRSSQRAVGKENLSRLAVAVSKSAQAVADPYVSVLFVRFSVFLKLSEDILRKSVSRVRYIRYSHISLPPGPPDTR